jgi:diphthamide synthase (EF-2-diphthine--ammonia ligase)
VSASTVSQVAVGARFDRNFVSALPSSIDGFGENGEFHTLVRPKGSIRQLGARLAGDTQA